MTSCLNFAAACRRSKSDGEDGSIKRTPQPNSASTMMMPKSWRRLQIQCRNRSSSMTTALDSAASFDRYTMLDDDDYSSDEEVGETDRQTNQCSIDDDREILFIPQWTGSSASTSTEPQQWTPCDMNSSDDDDRNDDGESNESITTNEMVARASRATLEELTGAFPSSSKKDFDTNAMILPPPSISIEEAEEIFGVYFLRQGDKIKVRRYTRPKKIVLIASVSDSETEEDSSSTSSIQEDAGIGANSDTPFATNRSINQNKQRSIRFSDEVNGQSLATFHFVPWSEHDDPEWIPRPVRCRIEL